MGRSAHTGSALFDPLPDAGDLFGRKRDVRVPQEAAHAALSVQVPTAAHVRNWSGAHKAFASQEIQLPVEQGQLILQVVLLWGWWVECGAFHL